MNLATATQLQLKFLSRIETVLWYVYLLFLVGVSFLPVRYENHTWMQFAALFYFYCAMYLCVLLCGGNFNRAALHSARVPLLISCLILLWLLIQAVLPVSNGLYSALFNSSQVPDWFEFRSTLSIEPHITHRVLFSNGFVFSWLLLTLVIITSRKRIKQLLITIMLIGLLHALIGLYAKFDNLILVDRQSIDGHFNVARGLFVNRNHYASFISITLFGSAVYFIKGLMQEWHQRKPMLAILDLLLSPKIIYVCAAVIGLIALILSHSRAGLFGFVTAFLFVFVFLLIFDKRISLSATRLMVFGSLLVGISLFFGQDLFARLSSEGFSLGERLVQWKITWQAIQDAPVLGYGAGSYSTVFQIYREHEGLRQVIFDQSHNEYLQLWLEQGVIGVILFCALFVVIINNALKIYKYSSSKLVSAISLSSMIVVIAVLAQAFVDFNMQIVNIRCFFFVIIGIMFASRSFIIESRSNGNT